MGIAYLDLFCLFDSGYDIAHIAGFTSALGSCSRPENTRHLLHALFGNQ